MILSFAAATAASDQPSRASAPSPAPTPGQWRDLFNRRDLTGWTTSVGDLGAWAAVDGELITVKPGMGDWLFTKKTYRDFELSLEFFLPVGANSGVGLRVMEIGDPGYGGYEIQLNDTSGQTPTRRSAGAVFDIAPARVDAIRPNQWNTLRIRLVGQTLDVWLNKVQIHRATQLPPLPDRDPFVSGEEKTGRISLQDNAGRVRYRHIRLRTIEPTGEPIFSRDRPR